jgi:adenylate kinase
MARRRAIPTAILLLGPTGSGKTPLGDLLEARGLGGRRCVHFDFGENLRQVATAAKPDALITPEDIEFCREVLRSGALLEDEDFPLAERILRRFLGRRSVDAGTVVVLNGLPRHVGQARALEAILDVQAVISLRCPPETALARIRGNIGGDRAGRADDDPALVARKLATFHDQTEPLVDHYRSRDCRVETVEVTVEMSAEEMWEMMNEGRK